MNSDNPVGQKSGSTYGMAEECEEPAVEVHIPVEGAVEYEPHDLCEEHAAMTNNKVRDIPRTDGGRSSTGSEQLDRAGDECYWCGGDLADGGSIRAQMREGEPKRETCPDCFRDWPPKQVEEEYMAEQAGDRDE